MRRNITVAVVATLLSVLVFNAPAGAGPSDRDAERHCVAVVADEADGVLRTAPPVCFASIADASSYRPEGDGVVAQSDTTIGWHFTETNYGGSSIQILGTTCSGGVWYATGSWDNNIESSFHYCGSNPTRFWDYGSCGGTFADIYQSSSSLGTMDNRTSCIQYG